MLLEQEQRDMLDHLQELHSRMTWNTERVRCLDEDAAYDREVLDGKNEEDARSQSRLRKMEADITEHYEQMVQEENERNHLGLMLTACENMQAVWREKTQSALQEVVVQRGRLEEAQQEMARRVEQANKSYAECSALRQEVPKLEQADTDLRAQLAELEQAAGENLVLDHELGLAERWSGELRAQLRETEQESVAFQDQLHSSEAQSGQTLAALGQAEQDRQELQDRLEATEASERSLSGPTRREALAAVEARRAELAGRPAFAEGPGRPLVEELARAQEERSRLESEVEELQQEAVSHQKELLKSEGENTTLHHRVEGLAQENTNLETENAGLQKNVEETRKKPNCTIT